MSEIITTEEHGIGLLDGLAKEAQYYAKAALNNTLQLGRVLLEAKALIPHGEWTDWIMENAGCSERTAQQFMKAYAKFGSMPMIEDAISRSKMFKMLALPDGTEANFIAEHNIAEMTSREVEAAVRQVRAEIAAELERERKARMEVEAQMQAMAEQPAEIPEELMQKMQDQEQMIASQRGEMQRLAQMSRESMDTANRLRRENAGLQREINERDEMIEEAQEACDRMQADLLHLQSAAAKGDAERIPADVLTIEIFTGAVRQFMGICASMPHMRRKFAAMQTVEKNDYDELLRTIETWAQEARKALEAECFSGEVFDCE